MQAARMLWLSCIAADRTEIRQESERLRKRVQLPVEEGNPYGRNVVDYFAELISNPRKAAGVIAVELQADLRRVTFEMRDEDDIVFQALDCDGGQAAHSVTISGTFLCRAAMAYTSRVWLPIDQSIHY